MANPLLEPSTLPFSLPPFLSITEDDYGPALEAGMAEQRAEIEAIATSAEPPTFDNTLVALERSGRLLDRALRCFATATQAMATPRIRDLDEEYSPKLAAHVDAVQLDPRIHARVKAVHDDHRAMAALDAESRRLVERYLTEMTVAGAGLDASATARLRDLNERLASLTSRFQNDVLAGMTDGALHVEEQSALAGLSRSEVSAAAAAAAARGLDGYVVTLGNTSGHPWLASLDDRDVRARLQQAQVSRGTHGDDHDTRATVIEITRLRAERAGLLGYPSHAAARLADSTAGTPAQVNDLLGTLAPLAARNAAREQEALESRAGHPVEAHDWAYYSERERAAAYNVDLAALRPYFEAGRVLADGVFFAANRLFGVTFHQRDDLTGYHPEVRVFEVREEDGTPIGLYLLDLYTREAKKGGAWMDSLVSQSGLLEQPYAVVTNNLNVPKPADGEPTLLTYDEVTTLFHEFGHALHGLLARVRYPHFSGTSVFRDIVEYPSQVNEMWMLWPEVVAHYAAHVDTGEPLPAEVVERMTTARAFGEGFATSEYLGAAILDQAWHALAPGAAVADADAFERQVLAAAGLDNPAVPPRYRTAYFAHAFSSDYDASYYAYLWSEVLDADTVAWFEENGGLTRDNGERYRRYIIGVGGSADLLASYRAFRGDDPDIRHLLRRRGLE